MSEESGRRDLPEQPLPRRLLEEFGGPVIGFGAVPEGHKGPYRPTPDELQEGLRRYNEGIAQLAELRAHLARENLRQTHSDQREG
jgi:hypothetical protein